MNAAGYYPKDWAEGQQMVHPFASEGQLYLAASQHVLFPATGPPPSLFAKLASTPATGPLPGRSANMALSRFANMAPGRPNMTAMPSKRSHDQVATGPVGISDTRHKSPASEVKRFKPLTGFSGRMTDDQVHQSILRRCKEAVAAEEIREQGRSVLHLF